MRRHRSPALACAAACVVIAALAGCSPDSGSAPGPTAPVEPAAPSGTPSVESVSPGVVSTVETLVSADDVTIAVRAPEGAVTTEPDAGWTSVTIDLTLLGAGQAATVGPASAGELLLRPDGSVTVRASSDDGEDGGGDRMDDDAPVDAVGGLAPPQGAAFRADDAGGLAVVPAEDADGSVTFGLGTQGVEATDWGEREGGRSLAVTPTDWARQARTAGVDVIWSELVADDPAVETATMHDQLVCHSIGAPDKATWNLEPWRPDVGLLQALAERCNPF